MVRHLVVRSVVLIETAPRSLCLDSVFSCIMCRDVIVEERNSKTHLRSMSLHISTNSSLAGESSDVHGSPCILTTPSPLPNTHTHTHTHVLPASAPITTCKQKPHSNSPTSFIRTDWDPYKWVQILIHIGNWIILNSKR